MSRVLARSMFKDQAPKQSGRGVGITSVVDDGTESGEIDNRRERERVARELFEKNKDEMDGYQTFNEGERPQLFRQPATMPMAPQPTPQQMQAMQMQQMAAAQQAGMLPRFAEGGPVETPSMWSKIKDFLFIPPGMDRPPTLAEMRRDMGRSIGVPALNNTGISSLKAQDDPNSLTPAINPDQMPTPMYRNPTTATLSEEPQPRQFPPEGTMTRPDSIGGQRPVMIPTKDEARVLRAQEKTPVAEDEAGREARRAAALSSLPDKTDDGEDEEDQGDQGEKTTPSKKAASGSNDLTDIKAERAAKQEAQRRENIWLAMMQAGLAIAGGKSSNAITNIGQGGQAGLGAFITLEQQRRRDEDASMRRDIAERELQLQTRRLNMQEPYIQAQTQYMLSKEGRDLAQLRQREYLAGLQAQRMAEQAWKEESKQMAYIGKKPEELAIARDIFLKNKTREFFKEKMLGLTPGVGAPASRETIPSSEE